MPKQERSRTGKPTTDRERPAPSPGMSDRNSPGDPDTKRERKE